MKKDETQARRLRAAFIALSTPLLDSHANAVQRYDEVLGENAVYDPAVEGSWGWWAHLISDGAVPLAELIPSSPEERLVIVLDGQFPDCVELELTKKGKGMSQLLTRAQLTQSAAGERPLIEHLLARMREALR
jgi:hypothetical protein